MCSAKRLTKTQVTLRPTYLWPEIWIDMSRAFKEQECGSISTSIFNVDCHFSPVIFDNIHACQQENLSFPWSKRHSQFGTFRKQNISAYVSQTWIFRSRWVFVFVFSQKSSCRCIIHRNLLVIVYQTDYKIEYNSVDSRNCSLTDRNTEQNSLTLHERFPAHEQRSGFPVDTNRLTSIPSISTTSDSTEIIKTTQRHANPLRRLRFAVSSSK